MFKRNLAKHLGIFQSGCEKGVLSDELFVKAQEAAYVITDPFRLHEADKERQNEVFNTIKKALAQIEDVVDFNEERLIIDRESVVALMHEYVDDLFKEHDDEERNTGA